MVKEKVGHEKIKIWEDKDLVALVGIQVWCKKQLGSRLCISRAMISSFLSVSLHSLLRGVIEGFVAWCNFGWCIAENDRIVCVVHRKIPLQVCFCTWLRARSKVEEFALHIVGLQAIRCLRCLKHMGSSCYPLCLVSITIHFIGIMHFNRGIMHCNKCDTIPFEDWSTFNECAEETTPKF